MMRSARDEVSACASVLATMKSTPERPDTIMLLTALPPAPPTPHTMMRGFNSLSSGALISIVIFPPRRFGARRRFPLFPRPSYQDPDRDPRRDAMDPAPSFKNSA